MNKQLLREKIKKERSVLKKEWVEKTSFDICKIFLESDIYKNAKVIGVYMSFKNEVCLDKIIKSAFADKKRLCTPITDLENDIIYFAEIFKDDVFSKGAFGIKEPEVKKKIDIKDVDAALVPGLLFDFCGARIGFGKGFYDKLLEKSDAVLVGVGYSFQLFDFIPSFEHDKKMNYIITEEGLIACEERL